MDRLAGPPTADTPSHTLSGNRGYPAAARGVVRRTAALLAAAALVTVPLTAGTAHAAGEGLQERQWGLATVNVREAWETTRGEGVTVAVLDTGVDATHPDLTGSVLEGKDLVGFGAQRGDPAWARHGTAMAGVIAGHGHDTGDAHGVLGVAPGAKILPVRVLLEEDDDARDEARRTRGDALAEGIRWAADNGADVINLSLGDDSDSAHPDPQQDAAVRHALRKGVVVVASAGNDGKDGDHVSYPAAYPGVIAVTAVDENGRRADFSTRRWYATVAAPGDDVIITEPDRLYYEGWGTSVAAAFVSGAAALVTAAHPDLTPAQVRQLLADTAQNTPPGGRSDALGTGVVDAAAAIEMGATVRPQSLEKGVQPYPERYFGAGPDDTSGGFDWLALTGAACGALLIAGAVALQRGARSRTH
ncbi:type VII secretion-associated serine protease mycosin [Streptomyces sp. DSM 42041]|uniref:Type VII secretion-associated serine protease mycosin n=1 Tax=Streptomyces hazeniae TaxID=3075538 RepID=A0ABU2NQB9_9ACTN|nr:type VII secretion-associated serine protease mycosin [Streptomyces sp. DSM 42041]MDT0379184.1 type VII secretion-associated serine protease mycosin [Streptomyces sp. DSM 42041]